MTDTEIKIHKPVYDDRRRPLFDSAWYVLINPDVRANLGDPYDHYRLFGRYEKRLPSAFSPFEKDLLPAPPPEADAAWYDEQKRLIERSALFDTEWYSMAYDLDRRAAIDHFVTDGAYVGCDPNPFFSTLTYLETFPDVLASGANPLSHFITDGYAEIEKGERDDPFRGRFELDENVWRTGRLNTQHFPRRDKWEGKLKTPGMKP